MTKFRKNKNINMQAGVGLVEIVVGAAILTVGILAVISSYSTFVTFAFANQKNVQASYLLEEELEAMAFLRDVSWSTKISTLSTTTTYYIAYNGSYWASTTTIQYVDGQFLRSFTVSDVKRDGTDKIASSGTYDPNTKKITATANYSQGNATTTKSISTYLTNIYGN